MTVGDVYSYIDSIAPFASQAAWDNSGILLGDKKQEVHKALICLDLTRETAVYAANAGCDLIVSHHPVIFRPLKTISSDSVFHNLIRSGVSVICAHTNLDKAPGGVNDTLCSLLFASFEKCGDDVGDGFLNTGIFENTMSPAQTARFLQERLGGSVRYIEGPGNIKKAAVCAGSGGEFYKEAAALGCDALITGDADHHDFLDAAALGLSCFAAGHYETEYPVVHVLAQKLTRQFTDIEFKVYPRMQTIKTI